MLDEAHEAGGIRYLQQTEACSKTSCAPHAEVMLEARKEEGWPAWRWMELVDLPRGPRSLLHTCPPHYARLTKECGRESTSSLVKSCPSKYRQH